MKKDLSISLKQVGFILLLHRVVHNPSSYKFPDCIGLETLSSQLEELIVYLIDNDFRFISIDELTKELTQTSSKSPFVCFTIDDGYRDVYTNAYPIFKKYKIPFTLYISNSFINSKPPIWHYIFETILNCNDKIFVPGLGKFFEVKKRAEKISIFNKLYNYVRNEINSKIKYEEFINSIMSSNSLESSFYDRFSMLSWKDILKISLDPLATIGCHTLNHLDLSILDYENIVSEISKSKDEIENELGIKVNHFSYPYGSFNRVVLNYLKESSFKTALSTAPRTICSTDFKNPFELPRLSFSITDDLNSFRKKLSSDNIVNSVSKILELGIQSISIFAFNKLSIELIKLLEKYKIKFKIYDTFKKGSNYNEIPVENPFLISPIDDVIICSPNNSCDINSHLDHVGHKGNRFLLN